MLLHQSDVHTDSDKNVHTHTHTPVTVNTCESVLRTHFISKCSTSSSGVIIDKNKKQTNKNRSIVHLRKRHSLSLSLSYRSGLLPLSSAARILCIHKFVRLSSPCTVQSLDQMNTKHWSASSNRPIVHLHQDGRGLFHESFVWQCLNSRHRDVLIRFD